MSTEGQTTEDMVSFIAFVISKFITRRNGVRQLMDFENHGNPGMLSV